MRRGRNPALTAGVVLSFGLGLFMAALILYGKLHRAGKNQRLIEVLFCNAGALRPEGVVRYNGLEVGRVGKMDVVLLGSELLRRCGPFSEPQLEHLPLLEAQRERLRQLPPEVLDRELRKEIAGRPMVLVTLEVRQEGEAQRYRVDDRIRIAGALLGQAEVAMVSGRGAHLPLEANPILLGDSGDLYSALSRSLEQLKNMLGSVGEMVGGGDEFSPLGGKIERLERFTERMERVTAGLQTQIPKEWDAFDLNLEDVEQRLNSAGKAIANFKPEVTQAMDQTAGSIAAMRQSVERLTGQGQKQVTSLRERILGELKETRAYTSQNRERIPLLVSQACEWSESFKERLEGIDRWLEFSDRALTQGLESVRQTLQGMRGTFDTIEARTWFLAKYPAMGFSSPSGLEGLMLQAEWQKALMARHFRELRGELEKASHSFSSADASDKARVQKVNAMLEALDQYLLDLEAKRAPERKKKG